MADKNLLEKTENSILKEIIAVLEKPGGMDYKAGAVSDLAKAYAVIMVSKIPKITPGETPAEIAIKERIRTAQQAIERNE